MRAILVLLAVVASMFYQTNALSCVPCVKEELCKDINTRVCSYGTALDMCGCCDVCAKGPGESCGGIWNHGGTCSKGLNCHPHPDPKKDQEPGTCSATPLQNPQRRKRPF